MNTVLHGLFTRLTAPWHLLVVSTLLLAAFPCSFCYDYAVQPSPVQFYTVPQSQTALAGEMVTLTCNFSISRLGSNYPEPHAVWRVNGSRDALGGVVITSRSSLSGGYNYSELTIGGVMIGHSGHYECLAVDGKRKGEFDGDGRYIVSSPRAYLHVISLDDYDNIPEAGSGSGSGSGSGQELYGMETVTLQDGEPYLIPCDVGLVSIPSHIQWFRNGKPANQTMLLVNGSLALPSAAVDDGGVYQCTVQFRNHTLNGPPLEIYISEELYSGEPQVFLDPPAAMISPGDHLPIRCYITGLTHSFSSSLRVTVSRGGAVQFTGPPNPQVPYQVFYVERTGRYDCQLRMDDNVISTASAVFDRAFVTVSDNFVVHESDGDEKTLTCGNSTDVEYSSLYWYMNGELLPTNGAVHRLAGDYEEREGVYQCFMVSPSGALYQHSWRVFDFRFANPPTNLQCDVRFSADPNNRYKPVVDMTWDPPDFTANRDIESYYVEADNGLNFSKYVTALSTQLELYNLGDFQTFEGVYGVTVRGDAPFSPQRKYFSAPRRCEVNTVSRAWNPPLPLKVYCAEEEPRFVWHNPLAANTFNVFVIEIKITAMCLYGNHSIYTFRYFENFGFDEDEEIGEDSYYGGPEETDSDFTLTLAKLSVPSGAVCIATGSYLLDKYHEFATTIRSELCMVPAIDNDERSVQLGLVCGEDTVDVSWNTSRTTYRRTAGISLFTTCLNSTDKLEAVFSATDADFAGNRSLPVESYSLCSFYGWYTDTKTNEQRIITPAQCYWNQPFTDSYPPVSIPDLSVYVVVPDTLTPTASASPTSLSPSSTSVPTTSASPPGRPAATDDSPAISPVEVVLQVVIPSLVLLVAAVGVIIVTVVFCCRRTTRLSIRHLQVLVDKDLNRDYRPFNPDVKDDGISLITIYDDGEDDWAPMSSSPPAKVDIGTTSSEGNSGSITEEMSSSLKERETPVLSPMTTAAVREDSGCDLQFELSTDDTHGKEHLFNRFLTGIDDDSDVLSSAPQERQQQSKTLESAAQEEEEGVTVADRHGKGRETSSSIANLVARRLHTGHNSTAPSSGYGTVDGYKLSTEASDLGQEYLARKLEEVDKMARESVPTEIDTENVAHKPTSSSDPALTQITSCSHGDRGTEQKIPVLSHRDKATPHLPSLLLTPPPAQTHTAEGTSSSLTQIPSLCAINATTSASTGDISYGSSYYQDREGYLHMAHTLHSGADTQLHQSLDTLTKSI